MSDHNIYQRILGVMGDVAYIQKEDKKVNNQYTFVSHDQVSRILHPILVKHGIVVIPTLKEWAQNGNRTEATVAIHFVNADKPDDRVIVDALGFGIDPQDKGPGKAISYATKYAMLKTFVLETGDDPERDMIDHVGERAEHLVSEALAAMLAGDWVALHKMDKANDPDWAAAYKSLKSQDRTEITRLKKRLAEYRDAFNQMAETEDLAGFAELDSELSVNEARFLVNHLGEPAKALMTELRKKA